MPSDKDENDAQRRMEEFRRNLKNNESGSNPPSWPSSNGNGPDSGAGSFSDGRFKNYVPTDKRAQAGKWSFFNGGGGGGGGPHNGGGGGGGCFAAPHQNTGSSNQKGRSSSLCDSGYSSSSSSSSFGRRNTSFNLGSPHSQGDTGFRIGSGGISSLESYGPGGDRNRHPASSGSGSSGGHRSFGRSFSESSASSMGSTGGFGGLSLAAIYEQEFGKKKK